MKKPPRDLAGPGRDTEGPYPLGMTTLPTTAVIDALCLALPANLPSVTLAEAGSLRSRFAVHPVVAPHDQPHLTVFAVERVQTGATYRVAMPPTGPATCPCAHARHAADPAHACDHLRALAARLVLEPDLRALVVDRLASRAALA